MSVDGFFLVNYFLDPKGIILHEYIDNDEDGTGFCGFHNPLTMTDEQRAHMRPAIFIDFADYAARIDPSPIARQFLSPEWLWHHLHEKLVPVREWLLDDDDIPAFVIAQLSSRGGKAGPNV